jgi:NAD(P) transhydrogenase subunit alpha
MSLVLVPKETTPGENRVAATPETVKALTKAGLSVAVEAGAGDAAGFPDREFVDGGAQIGDSDLRGTADLVLAIRAPGLTSIARHKAGSIHVSGLQPMLELDQVAAFAKAKVTSFGLELVPRITRAQKMDVLSSQATVAGYQAVLMAAVALPKMFPLLMTAAGTIRPSRVFVLGAGVAGLQAIATARRLGAVVEANDVRSAVREQVESLGARFVDTGTPADAETAGGYARETSADYASRQRDILTKHIAEADVVITTALIPGRPAPKIVTDAMVRGMRAGSVIVDLAVAAGGNVEGSETGKHIVRHGVKIIGEPNLPSLVACDASRMWARNTLAFVEPMIRDGTVRPSWDDEIIAATCVTRDGEIMHAAAREALSSKRAT